MVSSSSGVLVCEPAPNSTTAPPDGILARKPRGISTLQEVAVDGEPWEERATLLESGPTDKVVTVYRGADRESYSCMPVCERRITLGDSEKYFKSTIDQAGALNKQATGGGDGATTGKAN